MRTEKGQPGYVKARKQKYLLGAVVEFAIVIAIFVTGYIQTGSRLNLLTVVAVVGCLPAAKIRLHRKSNERRLQPKPQKRPQVHRLQRGFQFGKHIRRNIGRALNQPACLRDNALRYIEHGHDYIECV